MEQDHTRVYAVYQDIHKVSSCNIPGLMASIVILVKYKSSSNLLVSLGVGGLSMDAAILKAVVVKELHHFKHDCILPLGVAIGHIKCQSFIVIGQYAVAKLVVRSRLEGTHLGLPDEPMEMFLTSG